MLPATSKFLVDEVIGNARADLLAPLAAAAGLATLVQASTGFAISQILGVAAQKAITDLRKSVHDHVLQLPTAYFDSVKSGELISRIMTDAEGIRNPRRHRSRAALGRAPHGNDCAIGPLLSELAPHFAHARHSLVYLAG